ncbi:carboxymuconolactone decarboxylase family protein [Companilactobacillus metriopterae]|uniref:carboxymuconolactone decarboxylase family protein n=1 Tax=Companilactobacillus metriopterae TaxID=1909267 RepID=UPI00100AA953|nr:carboxymuconolactone decarboxylase family protein [Companilactobacillus metriopterae]
MPSQNKIDRLELGKQTLSKVDGSSAKGVMESLDNIAPDVGKYIFEFAFGDIYNRPGLDLKQREMVTITSLLTQGDTENQLKVHINGSLNVGLTQREIIETFIHCLPYVGFPKVLNAISVAKEVFETF